MAFAYEAREYSNIVQQNLCTKNKWQQNIFEDLANLMCRSEAIIPTDSTCNVDEKEIEAYGRLISGFTMYANLPV